MSRKNILIAIAVVLVGAAVVAANLYFKRDKGLAVTTEVDQERGTSKRSSRRRARFSRSGSSTSAPTRRAASSTSPSTKATASRRGSSCCRSTRSRCARASTAARRRCRRPQASLDQMRQSVETARVAAAAGAAEPGAPAGPLGAAADDARGAREGGERREGRRVGAAGAREADRAAGRAASRRSAPALESARYDLSKVRIESPIDGIVTRRNIQEGETAVDRHDEQRRHGAADARRHVGDPGRSRSRRDEHPERAARPARPRSPSTRMPDKIVQGARHRDRQQPDSGGDRRDHARRRRTSRWSSIARRADARVRPGLHLHGRHHDGDAQERRRRCRFRRSPCASWSTTPTARS